MSRSADMPDHHVSPLHIEALRLDLATPAERDFVREHLPGCAACRSLAESLTASHRTFANEVLPRTLPTLHRLLQKGSRRVVLALSGLVPLALAAGLLLVPWPQTDEPAYSVKASPALTVAARRGDRVFQPDPRNPVAADDQIRFMLHGVTEGFVLIGSVDGAGRASIYWPYEGQKSVPVPGGESAVVEGSIVLDASPGPERIFAFFSRAPLRAEMVRQALARLGARGAAAIRATSRIDVGADEQTSVLLEKALQ